MFQSDTPSLDLLKEVRGHLVANGTSLNAVCKENGLSQCRAHGKTGRPEEQRTCNKLPLHRQQG